jgi:hypothetical protein
MGRCSSGNIRSRIVVLSSAIRRSKKRGCLSFAGEYLQKDRKSYGSEGLSLPVRPGTSHAEESPPSGSRRMPRASRVKGKVDADKNAAGRKEKGDRDMNVLHAPNDEHGFVGSVESLKTTY